MRFFRRSDGNGLERIEQQIIQMLGDTHHEFDEAMSSLVGGADPTVLGPDIRVTRGRINASEREIRRELVVHAADAGRDDVSTILAYMIVVKKIERIGDNAKNIFDLSAEGVSFEGMPDADLQTHFGDVVSTMIASTSEIFGARDHYRANDFIDDGDKLLIELNGLVVDLIRSDAPAVEAVPRALLYRYMNRIVANLLGVVSSVVLPVDQIDYYDAHESRGGG